MLELLSIKKVTKEGKILGVVFADEKSEVVNNMEFGSQPMAFGSTAYTKSGDVAKMGSTGWNWI